MDTIRNLPAIQTVDTHTSGEPTRIVISGYPELQGTLLDQREQARRDHDDIRKMIMLEPRGHFDMYGAILRKRTEHTDAGRAHMGVLFTHNEGYSTMCGHATIALGRFLVDTHDLSVFPKRNELKFDPLDSTVSVNLHAPCGLVHIKVPATDGGWRADPSRPVSFLSSPAYAAALDISVTIPEPVRWPELKNPTINLDVSYGGAYYALIDVKQLGFSSLRETDFEKLSYACRRLKDYLAELKDPALAAACRSPDDPRLSFLYGIMVTENTGYEPKEAVGAETGVCFFAANSLDRSPTGSCVSARLAVANARKARPMQEPWAYHSLVSDHFHSGYFIGTVHEDHGKYIIARVSGFAYYSGSASFVRESADAIGGGFLMQSLGTH